MTAFRLLLHCLSPLHVGGGASQSGIEQAIARDAASKHPFVPASSLKGVLRDRTERDLSEDLAKALFGSNSVRGTILLGDANLLAFPVRSIWGTFAWATSPALLRKWKIANRAAGPDLALLTVPNPDVALAMLAHEQSVVKGDGGVILEDFNLTGDFHPHAAEWADHFSQMLFPVDSIWKDQPDLFKKRFCVLHDDVMNFLVEFATQLDPRVSLDDNKQVINFWHEEALPSESILGALCVAEPPRGTAQPGSLDTLRGICARPLQFGGDETIGRGITRAIVAGI